jgi:hypothetical protein
MRGTVCDGLRSESLDELEGVGGGALKVLIVSGVKRNLRTR